MEMNAYDEDYLSGAQKVLGHMMDFAVNTCELDSDQFFTMFVVSQIADQVEKGNPTYIAGMTGCELVRKILEKVGLDLGDIQDEMYLDRSPEYWSGWALAYYQWKTAKTFAKITKAVPVSEVIGMYGVLHEADISKFVTIMDEKMASFYTETNLKRYRGYLGYSQAELAQKSGVSLRQIQLFEQRQRDINKTQVENVIRLARTLGCRVEDLVE